MKFLFVFASGFLFAIGLGFSGMMNPSKVINFLDVFGNWDPSLIFVMGGALVMSFIAYKICARQKKPVCEPEFCLPQKTKVDAKLVIGSCIFGVGWGLGGICPGPAIANFSSLSDGILSFTTLMVVGLFSSGFIKGE